MGNSSSINNGNSTAAPRVDGEEDRISNKRKRSCDGNGDVSIIGQPLEMLGSPNDDGNELDFMDGSSLSTMPDSVLLHTFGFILSLRGDWGNTVILENMTTQLALEKTCRRFHALLGQDSTMNILYSNSLHYRSLYLCEEYSYQVESLREKLFIRNGLRLIRKYQKGTRGRGTDHLICHHMGGANGLRRVVDKILVQMEQPDPDEDLFQPNGMAIPPEFPPNGFKLFLRGDSIAYLAEIVQQHMVDRWENAMHLAVFRSRPADSHPYPEVCPYDLSLVDAIRGSYEKECRVARHRHHCSKLSLGDTLKKWVWPENDCMDDEIIGAETMQRLVRAIAFQAGIVKLSGPAFECIAAEILHYLALIVIDAFEVSKSLWCQEANVGRIRAPFAAPARQVIADDIICDLSKCTLTSEDSIHSENSHDSEKSFALNYMSNYPPPMEVDEDGKHVCVIIPRQIKDAAVRFGMKPLLDDQRWEVSEGRTKREEVKEALLMYGLSLDDESSMLEEDSDVESVWQPSDEEESSESD